MIRLVWYFGLGALAHWLWIGSHVDPTDIFTYVCLLLGPIMCFAWVFMKALWVGAVLIALAIAGVFLWAMSDKVGAWNRRREREIDRARVINEAKSAEEIYHESFLR